MLAEALQREYGVPKKQLVILDAGCGTGLSGPLITDYAAKLVGVDLSAGILAKAKSRNVYDELIKAELTTYLRTKLKAFDVILMADTFIYFGALNEVLAAARSALRDGGYLFFSAESLVSDNPSLDYYLNPHGRYCQSDDYLKRTLKAAGFTIVALDTAVLRHEKGSPVQSFIVSCCAV
ncbi:MAG TPA: methyltransferase domain-containing protein [Spongiibacteraceae bacterium]|nr:methyltransferase domain-containing protein [Spongiibacteraceae bacterium]